MRKELCRNFQRGSCRYGEGCRFLHPQQAKPNNPFDLGTQSRDQQQQQQQKSSNPFGFGVQGGGSNRPNQFQPFENKWSRTAPTPSGGGGSAAQQTGKQTQQADHKCTDPAACKRLMQDDFKNERPMWKLTCYGHWKNFPCDIAGDISYEELRAMAYEEAKRGIPLHSIVERERNLQNSKIAEFDNFLQSPYRGSVTANHSPFAATTPSIFPPASQINSPPAFSAFNQQVAFPNTNAGGVSSSGPPNAFASFNQQPNAFSVNTPQPVPSGGFQFNPSTTSKPASFGPGPGLATTPQNNNIFKPASFGPGPGLATAPQNNNIFKPASFGPGPGLATAPQNNNIFKPASFGPGPGLATAPQNNNIFASTTSKPVSFGPGPGLATAPQNNNIFPSITPTPALNTFQNNQTAFNFNVPVASFTAPVSDAANASSGTELQREGASVDPSIWLKEKWNPGEIPEQAPPDAFV